MCKYILDSLTYIYFLFKKILSSENLSWEAIIYFKESKLRGEDVFIVDHV